MGEIYLYIGHTNQESLDLCGDCSKALQQFLNDRYNNVKKGVNTGLTFPSNSYGVSLTGTTTANTINDITLSHFPDDASVFTLKDGNWVEAPPKKKKPTKKNSNNKKANNKRK